MAYRERLEAKGLVFSGTSPDGLLPETIEYADHPWFIGVQYHPELKSRPFEPHPLFQSFIGAAVASEPRWSEPGPHDLEAVACCPMPSRRRVGCVEIGNHLPLTLIAGPCQMESRDHALKWRARSRRSARRARHRAHLQDLLRQGEPHLRRRAPAASGSRSRCRSSPRSSEKLGLPVLTDMHEIAQCAPVAEVGRRAADPGLPVPSDRPPGRRRQDRRGRERQEGPVPRALGHGERRRQADGAGNPQRPVTERGVSFGYNTLVSDMRALPIMAATTGRR